MDSLRINTGGDVFAVHPRHIDRNYFYNILIYEHTQKRKSFLRMNLLYFSCLVYFGEKIPSCEHS